MVGAHIDIALRREFGEKRVFRDERFIVGGHFTDKIRRNLEKCDVLVVVLSPRRAWEAEGTDRRVSDSFWARREIAIAFESGLAVLPVLVDGAVLPDRTELPDDIKPLADRQALSFRTYLGHLDFPPLFQAIREAAPTGGNERRDGDGTPTGAQEAGPFRREEGRV